MRATIDAKGRLVIPKAIREQARLRPGTPLEVRYVDGLVEIEPGAMPVTLVRRGRFLVAVPDAVDEPLTNEVVQETLEALRRERGAIS